ncbi:MAG: hypothetical protein U5L09_01885 [Bacteroidales bacterium]|nr:hypothetical protein [Bacteroidales bacterium]
MKKIIALLLPVLILTASCMNNNRPEKVEMKSQAEEKKAQGEASASEQKIIDAQGDEIAFANFTLQKPEDWIISKPSSEMRLIEFVTPKSPENPIVGFYFGNRDEMVKANIDRWRGQFAKQENFNKETMENDGRCLWRLTALLK